ncbi:MAG: MGMT family protein [Dendronalium sp. ChiSLP03b]|nr:MGMT family protein [Dendronalium sp. ChiSLP03b]MDZ8205033.1 MGMT family protein [Dendronalium sp. ChiSLP03b]
MFSTYGSILHLFTKQKHSSPMREVQTLNLKLVHGIKGDINANPISPRQVLVVRHEDIVELAIQPGELRENVVITGIESKNFVPGALINFDSGAAIRLTFHCEPCKRIAHLVKSLKVIQGRRGILGVVIKSGAIQVGSNCQIEPNRFPALSENVYERFLSFIKKVPSGKVVTYKQIIQAIGVDNSYMRVIPIYIKKTSLINYPIHRILDSKGNLITYIPNQKDKLESEGIKFLCAVNSASKKNEYFGVFPEYLYEDETIYLN